MDDLKEMIKSLSDTDKNEQAPVVTGEFDESTRKYIIKMPVESYSQFR